MKKIHYLLLVVLLGILLYSCQKEFSIYAPYNSKTIVVGILDPSADTQYVRINRTWQGEGNNLDYAMTRDSSEYQWDAFNSIQVHEISENGNVTNTFNLQEIEKQDKDENGIFYGPEYTAYYFVYDDFQDDATYKLDIDFKNKIDVSAETNVIVAGSGLINKPFQSAPQNFTVTTANVIQGTNVDYQPTSLKWEKFKNAGRYSVALLIHYKEKVWEDLEHTLLLSETDKSIHWNIDELALEDGSNDVFTTKAEGAGFYNVLKANLEEDLYVTRELGFYNETSSNTEVFSFLLTIANADFESFLNVNQVSTSIVQEKPQFTTINNGLGVFASKTTVRLDRLKLSFQSNNAIPLIDDMAFLNICSPGSGTDISCD